VWNERKTAGLALGALLWGDRPLARAALTEALLDGATQRLAPLENTRDSAGQKQRLVRELVEQVRPEPRDTPAMSGRVRALLARHVPRELGRRWLEGTIPARTDYSAPEELVRTLLHWLRLAQPPHKADAPTNPER